MTLKEQIQKIYFEIQTRFYGLIDSCSDNECFSIGYFPIENVKHDLLDLDTKINEYNIEIAISADKPIDVNKDLCSLLNKIPDLNITYLNHKSKAETIHNDFFQKEFTLSKSSTTSYPILTDRERNRWNQASSFCHNTEKQQIYSNLQNEIDNLKKTYCKFQNDKPWLKLKPGFLGKENINVIEFCNSLVGLGYFDKANADIFKKLLLGENITDSIEWAKNPADVCRVIISLKDHKLLTAKPQWKCFEKKFIINGKPVVKLQSGTKLTIDRDIEDVVKKYFRIK